MTNIASVRFFSKNGQDMARGKWNRLEVVAQDAEGWSIEFNKPNPIAVTFLNGEPVATFQRSYEPATYRANILLMPPDAPQAYTLNAVLKAPDGTEHPFPDLSLDFTVSRHGDAGAIIVSKSFAVSDFDVVPEAAPPAEKTAVARVAVFDDARRVANVQVIWSFDPPVEYAYLYDRNGKAPTPDDIVEGRYVTLTDAEGESELYIASALPVVIDVKAEIQGQDNQLQGAMVFASLNYMSANAYDAPTVLSLETPPGGGQPGIVIRANEEHFNVMLLPSLPRNTDLFVDMNDKACPVKINAGSSYARIQPIPYTYLDYSGGAPYYQTLKYFTQSDGAGTRASRSVTFPVYGFYKNRPNDNIAHRPFPAVAIQRDPGPGGIVDLFTVTPELDFSIPAYQLARNDIKVTLYLNGYYSGTDTPRAYWQTWPITALGANARDVPANTAVELKIPFAILAGYDRSRLGALGELYLEYSAIMGGEVFHSKYVARLLLTT
jgi:hypothetical protein